MFSLTRPQCKLEATCRLTQPLPSQMLIPFAPFHRCLGFRKNTSNLPVYDVYPCDSVWVLSKQCQAMSSNVKQCQAAKQAGVTLWVQTESGVEDLATPKMLEDFSPCDRVTTPRLPKIPDLKQQMVPDHKAAICCNWSCGACRLLRWFTIRKSWTGQTLISENMWPVKQVILLAECTKHLAVCLKSMFMHISHSVLRWKLGRAALDAEAVRRQFFFNEPKHNQKMVELKIHCGEDFEYIAPWLTQNSVLPF